jgi:hypothetical protein
MWARRFFVFFFNIRSYIALILNIFCIYYSLYMIMNVRRIHKIYIRNQVSVELIISINVMKY